jgi:chemotaxis protein MotB
MSNRLAFLATLILSGAAAIGCASGDLQRRVDELTLENEELQRQKGQTESDLMSAQAKIDALEREKQKQAAERPGVAVTPFEAKPDTAGLDVRRRGQETVINLPTDIFFSSGSASLSGSGERAMAKVVDYLRKHHAEGKIRVEGHSDADPIRRTKDKWHCNWSLSFERAHAVLHHLVEKGGVDPRRVVCESHAEHSPAEAGDKSKNRRVEIVVAP